MNNNFMLFRETDGKEFDFDSLIKEKGYATLSGLPVKIDRIIKDITRTTVIAISGTFVVKGVRFRGTWDMFGNIIELGKMLNLLFPRSIMVTLDKMFKECPIELFKLVYIQEDER